MQNKEKLNRFISKRESEKYFPQANADVFDLGKGDNIQLRFKIHLKRKQSILVLMSPNRKLLKKK
jgi:hypothetical protein